MRQFLLKNKQEIIDQLPKPYCNIETITIKKENMSVYNEGQRVAELNGIVVQAVLDYFAGEKALTALVQISDNTYAAEAQTTDGTLLLTANTNGRIRGALCGDDGSYAAVPPLNEHFPYDPSTVILLLLPILRRRFDEVSRILDSLESDANHIRPFSRQDLYRISDSVYRILVEKRMDTDMRDGNIALLEEESVQSGGLIYNRVLCGCPSVLCAQTREQKKGNILTVAEAKEEFRDFAQRNTWTAQEEEYIPVYPDDFAVPAETLKIARRYVYSSTEKRPMVNFMWRGVTAYGKSTGVEILACILHMPLLRVTCSSNMETQDFLSDFVPNTDTSGGTDAPRFMHIESNYVKALDKGYIVEVQEISRIKDSGVLVGLNEYDRAGAMIPLVDGSCSRRHKRALVVYTDNVGYNSCRPIDASVIRRMAFIIDSYDLPKDKALARLELNTGVHNQGVLEKCYNVWINLRDFCYTRGITDGSISLSELEMWVLSVKLDDYTNYRENCIECVVAKATNDMEEQEEIISSVVDLYL